MRNFIIVSMIAFGLVACENTTDTTTETEGKTTTTTFTGATDDNNTTVTTPTTDAAHPGRWIGIANDAISDTATGTITSVGGIGTGQSSLTVGSMYGISSSGTIGTLSTFYGDTSYATVGVALTTSTIFITGGIANG